MSSPSSRSTSSSRLVDVYIERHGNGHERATRDGSSTVTNLGFRPLRSGRDQADGGTLPSTRFLSWTQAAVARSGSPRHRQDSPASSGCRASGLQVIRRSAMSPSAPRFPLAHAQSPPRHSLPIIRSEEHTSELQSLAYL